MKKVPEFKNEDEEFEFWSSTGAGADSTEYVDWSKATRVKLVKLKPTLRTISVRLPVAMVEDLRSSAQRCWSTSATTAGTATPARPGST